MKLAKILILSVIFMLMTSLCLAVTDEKLADTGLEVGDYEKEYFRGSMDKTEGGRYSFLNNAGDWLKYVTSGGQGFIFSEDSPDYVHPLSCTEDLSNSPSHVYLVYPGGLNENNGCISAGVGCDVGQYIEYMYWSSEAQDDRIIFAESWYKSDEDDLMQYCNPNYDLNDWLWEGRDSEYIQAYYRCFDCEVPLIYGCTDPTATNYDPEATVDDISCEYESCEEFNDYVLINGETRYEHVCDDVVNIRQYECDGDQLDYGFVECAENYACEDAECVYSPDPVPTPDPVPCGGDGCDPVPVPVEDCTDGEVIEQICPDGISTQTLELCVAGDWVDVEDDCPEEPEDCTDGEQILGACEDGSTYAQYQCTSGVWEATGDSCNDIIPPIPIEGDMWYYVYGVLALLLVLLGVFFFYKPKKGKRRRKK